MDRILIKSVRSKEAHTTQEHVLLEGDSFECLLQQQLDNLLKNPSEECLRKIMDYALKQLK